MAAHFCRSPRPSNAPGKREGVAWREEKAAWKGFRTSEVIPVEPKIRNPWTLLKSLRVF
jgi:hypothetical protein